MTNYQNFIKAGCTFLCISALSENSAAQLINQEKPNVILINVDDLGYGDLGCYGASKVKTPNIDNLATQGTLFTDAHSCSAVSSPSRYGLLTGSYPFRKNLWGPLMSADSLVINEKTTTIADILKGAGYKTACIGKWHLGFGKKIPVDWNSELNPGPLELGFDYYFGVPVLNSHPPFVYVKNHYVLGLDPADPIIYNILPFDGFSGNKYFWDPSNPNKPAETRWFREKFGMNLLGGGRKAHSLFDDRSIGKTLKDEAIRWIKENKNEPFFLYYATTNIHHPFTPSSEFIGTSQSGVYGDFIHELDWLVGEILHTLDNEGLSENTLVIFTSDNGGMLNIGAQEAWRLGHKQNGELLGFKFGAWEGGHRIPFIVRWPGYIPEGKVSKELISNVDILATFASLVGHKLKIDEGLDSYNLLPAFVGKNKNPIRDHFLITPSNKKNLGIRKGKWVYIDSSGDGGFGGTTIGEHTLGSVPGTLLTHQTNSDIEYGKIKDNAPQAQLYDLEKDPFQQDNLYNKNKAKAKELKELLNKILISKKTSPR